MTCDEAVLRHRVAVWETDREDSGRIDEARVAWGAQGGLRCTLAQGHADVGPFGTIAPARQPPVAVVNPGEIVIIQKDAWFASVFRCGSDRNAPQAIPITVPILGIRGALLTLGAVLKPDVTGCSATRV